MTKIIRILDLETCGFPADGNGQIVEVATLDLEPAHDGTSWAKGRVWSSLCNPGRPIPPESSAVHHLTDDDVKDAPPFADVLPLVTAPPRDDVTGIVFCAHNAKFEKECWPEGAKAFEWICTYRVGVTLWPESPGHSNQVLKYWLKLKLVDPSLATPHRASGDVYVTGAILRRALMGFEVTVDDLVKISSNPVKLPRFHFGVHAMKPLADVPTSYLEWMSRQESMDEDALYTARTELYERRQLKKRRSPVNVE